MTALRSRGGTLAIALAAALMLAVGLAAGGAFQSCAPAQHAGRPSQAVSDTAPGAVARVTAEALALAAPRRATDTWGEIRARELVFDTFQQYGYFPRTQEFLAGSGADRVHSANIVAVKQGEAAQRLIIGAHYDASPKGQGYADNASGVGLLLEMAARFKSEPTPYTLVFIAFGAEESGLAGSRYYARTMDNVERDATIGMIGLDAVAGGDVLSVTSRFGGATWLRDDALTAAKSLGIALASSPQNGDLPAGVILTPSDDEPFAMLDIPTATFTATNWEAAASGLVPTAEGRLWHTPKDTVKYIEKTYPGRMKRQLAAMSRLLETLLTSKLEKRP